MSKTVCGNDQPEHNDNALETTDQLPRKDLSSCITAQQRPATALLETRPLELSVSTVNTLHATQTAAATQTAHPNTTAF